MKYSRLQWLVMEVTPSCKAVTVATINEYMSARQQLLKDCKYNQKFDVTMVMYQLLTTVNSNRVTRENNRKVVNPQAKHHAEVVN